MTEVASGTDERDTFCRIPTDLTLRESPFDLHQPIGDGDVYLTPTVGPIAPGHFLVVTREHYTSFASLGHERLAQVDEDLAPYEKTLRCAFGDCFRLEHGSDNLGSCGSGACIDHAHIQLFSGVSEAGERIQEALPWQQLDSFADLADFAGAPYIYLGRAGLHFAVAKPNLPSQWGRTMVAEALGIDKGEADWAMRPGIREQYETFMRLGKFPTGNTILYPDGRVRIERRPPRPGREQDPPYDEVVPPTFGTRIYIDDMHGETPRERALNAFQELRRRSLAKNATLD